MKICTRVVINIATLETIEEVSFEYDGELQECKGGDSAPKLSTQEKELIKSQTLLVNQQVSQATLQNELIERLWPQIAEAQEGTLAYDKLVMEASKELLPLQTKLAEQGIDLQSIQMDALKSEIGRNKALEPALLGTLGFKLQDGKYVPTKEAADPLQIF